MALGLTDDEKLHVENIVLKSRDETLKLVRGIMHEAIDVHISSCPVGRTVSNWKWFIIGGLLASFVIGGYTGIGIAGLLP